VWPSSIPVKSRCLILPGSQLSPGSFPPTSTREKLAKSLPWVQDVSDGTLRLTGVAEFAAAQGLILPAATGIAVWLTPLAACGLALIMVLAAGFHARRKEPGAIAVNVFLLALAAFAAWGRFGPYSF
jgi:uncharacterized membrane protein SirB2